MTPISLTLTTVENESDARALARKLVETRLAACVSIVPIAASVYRWNGKLEEAKEFLLLIKSLPEREDALLLCLSAEHPSELPEILRLEPAASRRYAAWIAGELRPDASIPSVSG
jgi:periplasmic divalent cation tolerance protein